MRPLAACATLLTAVLIICILFIWLPCVFLGVMANRVTDVPEIRAKQVARQTLATKGKTIVTLDGYDTAADAHEALIAFLGLEWEPACRDFHRTERPVLTASAWQVRQPLYTRSVGRWRCYERHLRPLSEVVARRRKGLSA